jgi:hypothetical protein
MTLFKLTLILEYFLRGGGGLMSCLLLGVQQVNPKLCTLRNYYLKS